MAKRKNKKLEWYAFREDFNRNELERFNVLGEWFAEDLLKRIKSDKKLTIFRKSRFFVDFVL